LFVLENNGTLKPCQDMSGLQACYFNFLIYLYFFL